jgi:seryl-tRNA synthetase
VYNTDVIDLKLLKEHPDVLRQALKRRGDDLDLDRIIQLDELRRKGITEIEQLKQKRNVLSEKVAELRRQKKDTGDLVGQAKDIGQVIKTKEKDHRKTAETFQELASWIPNIPHKSVPTGSDSGSNVFVRGMKEPPRADFDVLPHWEIGAALDMLDLKRASKISGSRFIVFKGKGAALERALINFFIDLHTRQHGYTEIAPPVLNSAACLFGTGQLPKLASDMYTCQDDLYLCPTAEVPLTNLHRDEIIPEKELPLRYVAYTPCFRKESGSYGKDVKGIKRVHQFDKVELVKYTSPESGYDEFEKLLSDAETAVRLLGLPYRIMLLCTGDMTFASAKTYDIEVYAQGVKEWLEVSSVSIYEQFQARRAQIRFRPPQGSVDYVFTMNGSGLALPRIFIAILENYQTPDGKIRTPDALRPYFDDKDHLA